MPGGTSAATETLNWCESTGPCRRGLGDGNFGGLYQRSDDEMASIWKVAVEETRTLIADGWE